MWIWDGGEWAAKSTQCLGPSMIGVSGGIWGPQCGFLPAQPHPPGRLLDARPEPAPAFHVDEEDFMAAMCYLLTISPELKVLKQEDCHECGQPRLFTEEGSVLSK